MRDKVQSDKARMSQVLTGRILLLLFGLGVLGFLVAIERAEWSSFRPETGTSIAMARGAEAGLAAVHQESSTTPR